MESFEPYDDYNPFDGDAADAQKILRDLGIDTSYAGTAEANERGWRTAASERQEDSNKTRDKQDSNVSSHERYSPDPTTSDGRSGVSMRRAPNNAHTTGSGAGSRWDEVKVVEAQQFEQDDFAYDPTLDTEEGQYGDGDTADDGQEVINNLYSELESMQETFKQLTDAMKASEDEKSAMFVKLQQATAKMQHAIRQASMSQPRSSGAISALEKEVVVMPPKQKAVEVASVGTSTDGVASPYEPAPVVHVGPAQWQMDDINNKLAALEATVVTLEGENSALKIDLAASEKKRERQRALIRENDERIASLMAALADAPIVASSHDHHQHREHHVHGAPSAPSTSAGAESRDALARQKLLFAATEEKLWQVIHCRGKQLQHVSRLLASVEGRNVELAKLMDRFSKNLEREVTIKAPAAARSVQGRPPQAAAASSQQQQTRPAAAHAQRSLASQSHPAQAAPRTSSPSKPRFKF